MPTASSSWEYGKGGGILTDRDIAIRVVAEGKSSDTPVAEIVSDSALLAVSADMSVDQAISLMRSKALRRLLVLEEDRVVGVVGLSDLAIERNPDSALAGTSAADAVAD